MAKRLEKSHKQMAETLKARGLRVTPQRLQIALRVLSKHAHFTAEEIAAWAAKLKFRFSRATVYNTLNEFVAVGLLKSFYSSSNDKLIFDSNTDKHFHFLDVESNEIFDVDPHALAIEAKAPSGYLIEDTVVFFRGRKLK